MRPELGRTTPVMLRKLRLRYPRAGCAEGPAHPVAEFFSWVGDDVVACVEGLRPDPLRKRRGYGRLLRWFDTGFLAGDSSGSHRPRPMSSRPMFAQLVGARRESTPLFLVTVSLHGDAVVVVGTKGCESAVPRPSPVVSAHAVPANPPPPISHRTVTSSSKLACPWLPPPK